MLRILNWKSVSLVKAQSGRVTVTARKIHQVKQWNHTVQFTKSITCTKNNTYNRSFSTAPTSSLIIEDEDMPALPEENQPVGLNQEKSKEFLQREYKHYWEVMEAFLEAQHPYTLGFEWQVDGAGIGDTTWMLLSAEEALQQQTTVAVDEWELFTKKRQEGKLYELTDEVDSDVLVFESKKNYQALMDSLRQNPSKKYHITEPIHKDEIMLPMHSADYPDNDEEHSTVKYVIVEVPNRRLRVLDLNRQNISLSRESTIDIPSEWMTKFKSVSWPRGIKLNWERIYEEFAVDKFPNTAQLLKYINTKFHETKVLQDDFTLHVPTTLAPKKHTTETLDQ